MWVHRSGEFYRERPVIIYEYQKGRDHQKPLSFYKDYKGILVTDGLQQYHLVDKKLPRVTNANCWAHAGRDFADAVKAMDKKDPSAVRNSVAYVALQKIGEFYNADTELKGRKRSIASTCSSTPFSAIIVSHYTESKKLSTQLF